MIMLQSLTQTLTLCPAESQRRLATTLGLPEGRVDVAVGAVR